VGQPNATTSSVSVATAWILGVVVSPPGYLSHLLVVMVAGMVVVVLLPMMRITGGLTMATVGGMLGRMVLLCRHGLLGHRPSLLKLRLLPLERLDAQCDGCIRRVRLGLRLGLRLQY